MKKLYLTGAVILVVVAIAISLLSYWLNEQKEQGRYERGETELFITNLSGGSVDLFKAGKTLAKASAIPKMSTDRIWLPQGNYFVQIEMAGRRFYYPVPLSGYRCGPDADGAFTVTIRPLPREVPPRLLPKSPAFAFIPSGHFLFGDRLRVHEPHYVWLTGFFLSTVEVTNAEFREFLSDPQGYRNDANWTTAGKLWKQAYLSHATALLKEANAEYERFGRPDFPVVAVNWFEASAFCRWMTQRIGQGKWIFELPTEAEWEKAARGPDSFDYSLGMNVSDAEISLYNWRKNPGASITVVGLEETLKSYRPNRYGLYHMTGNVAEWTKSVYRSFSQEHPFADDDRNQDNTPGERVVRGGSWYTATTAVLYIPYRENFQPEIQTPYLGFRVAVRRAP